MKRPLAVLAAMLALASPAFAGSGRQLYQLHCWGCHRADGQGIQGAVPPIAGATGYFLHIPEGRAYLVQVPGVAGSLMSDAEVAEVLNWALLTFCADEIPKEFAPYSAHEVAQYRRHPLIDLFAVRAKLAARLRRMGYAVPDLDKRILPGEPAAEMSVR